MIGGHGDDDALVQRIFELGFKEVADFAATFPNQAHDDDVGFGPGDHLAHQDRLADARARNDGDALASSGGEQRVDRAHAKVERLGDTATVQDVAFDAVERPAAARDDRSLAVERLAHGIDDPADQPFADLHHIRLAVRLDARAIFQRHIIVEWHEQRLVAAKADDFGPADRPVRCDHPRARADRLAEACDLQHARVVAYQTADMARCTVLNLKMVEQAFRLGKRGLDHAQIPFMNGLPCRPSARAGATGARPGHPRPSRQPFRDVHSHDAWQGRRPS